MRNSTFAILLSFILAPAFGIIQPPRLRPSPYFGSLTGMNFTPIQDLGSHHYNSSFGENNALIYTGAAGYIDLGHLRESADRTRYLFEVCHQHILKGNKEFSFTVIEPAEYYVYLTYPPNWENLDNAGKQQISREAAIILGQHFAHLSTIWHEIVTWYGYASTGLISEKASSFSWEDSYSDLLGTKLGAKALQNPLEDYDNTMTELILEEIRKLDPQSVEIAKQATGRIQGKWFSGRFPFLSMNKRHFDVGFDDGMIHPFRVPGICSESDEAPCHVPSLEKFTGYGFRMKLVMIPRESERKDIFKIIPKQKKEGTLEPAEHFPKIISHIRQEAIRQSGKGVDEPTL